MLSNSSVLFEKSSVLLISESAYSSWLGTQGKEYEQVCKSAIPFDILKVKKQDVAVLTIECDAIYWFEDSKFEYIVHNCEPIPLDEDMISQALKSLKAKSWKEVTTEFNSEGGKYLLINAFESGEPKTGSVELELQKGVYSIHHAFYEGDAALQFLRMTAFNVTEDKKIDRISTKKIAQRKNFDQNLHDIERILLDRDAKQLISKWDQVTSFQKFPANLISNINTWFTAEKSQDVKTKLAKLLMVSNASQPELLKSLQNFVVASSDSDLFRTWVTIGTVFDLDSMMEEAVIKQNPKTTYILAPIAVGQQIEKTRISMPMYQKLFSSARTVRSVVLADLLANQIIAHKNNDDLRFLCRCLLGLEKGFFDGMKPQDIDDSFELLLKAEDSITQGKGKKPLLLNLNQKSFSVYFSSLDEGLKALASLFSNSDIMKSTFARKWLSLLLKDRDPAFNPSLLNAGNSFRDLQKSMQNFLSSGQLDEKNRATINNELRNGITEVLKI